MWDLLPVDVVVHVKGLEEQSECESGEGEEVPTLEDLLVVQHPLYPRLVQALVNCKKVSRLGGGGGRALTQQQRRKKASAAP